MIGKHPCVKRVWAIRFDQWRLIHMPTVEKRVIPTGHAFTSLVLSLLRVGGHPPKVAPEVIEATFRKRKKWGAFRRRGLRPGFFCDVAKAVSRRGGCDNKHLTHCHNKATLPCTLTKF